MISPDFTDTIKRTVTARDVAERYGLTVSRHNYACCPYHGDKTPSMKLYQGERGFYCFGCHVGGSSIDLAMKLLGVDFRGAIRQLNDDFGLNLPLDQKLSSAEKRRAAQVATERAAQAEVKAQKKRELDANLDVLAHRYLFLLQLSNWHRPTRSEPEFSELWCYAMEELPQAKEDYERMDYELRKAYVR